MRYKITYKKAKNGYNIFVNDILFDNVSTLRDAMRAEYDLNYWLKLTPKKIKIEAEIELRRDIRDARNLYKRILKDRVTKLSAMKKSIEKLLISNKK